MKKRSYLKLLLLMFSVGFLTAGACPDSSDSLVDEVKTALDQGDYTTAVTKADELLVESDTPTNRLLVASAYTGRSTLDLLDLVGKFADLVNGTVSDFQQIACVVQFPDPTANLADLRKSITTLQSLGTALDDDANKEAAFELGMLEAIEAFVLPTNKGATPAAGTNLKSCSTAVFTATATTVGNISEADRVNVQADFVDSDNRLRKAGLKNDNDILKALFQTYCRLKSASVSDGFTQGDLQAFTWCEMNTAGFPAGGFGGIATCLAFAEAGANSAAITACKASTDLTP